MLEHRSMFCDTVPPRIEEIKALHRFLSRRWRLLSVKKSIVLFSFLSPVVSTKFLSQREGCVILHFSRLVSIYLQSGYRKHYTMSKRSSITPILSVLLDTIVGRIRSGLKELHLIQPVNC